MPHHDTFRIQLGITHPEFGHALWDTNPGDDPPVEVGDVGFARQGKFHRLFNTRYSADHPSNNRFGVPEDHEQLSPVLIDHGNLHPNNFCSYGVTVTSSRSDVFASGPPVPGSAEVSVSCTKKNGAILSLPVVAQREDAFAQAHFRKWIAQHIDSWFAFSQRHGLGIEMEEILLVTGLHRARSSGNIVFYESQVDARVSFGVQVPGIIGSTVNWRFSSQHIQGAVVSHGPSGENLPENQCIFVRGFRVERTFRIFSKIRAAAEPESDPSGGDDEPETKVVSIPSATDYRDPLHVLLEYIAERAPSSDLVLVHDDDLARILAVVESDLTSLETLQPAEVMDFFRRSKLEVGVMSDSCQCPANDKSPRPDKENITVAMLSEQLDSLDGVSLEEESSPLSQAVDLSSPASLEKFGELSYAPEAVQVTYSATGIHQKIWELLSIAPPGTERHIQSIDEDIERLRDAAKECSPGSYVFYALAIQLCSRFMQTLSNDDYAEATALLERIVDPNYHGEGSDSIRRLASSLAAVLTHARWSIFELPEYSEVAISRFRTALSSPSISEGLRPGFTELLATQTRRRFKQYSLAESLEEANSYSSQAVSFSSSSSLAKSGELSYASEAIWDTYSVTEMQQMIQGLEELLSITPPSTERHRACLSTISKWYERKFQRTNDILDIEESIKYNRLSLDATHSDDLRRITAVSSLRNALDLAFEKTAKMSYLDESITLGYDILELRSAQHIHFHVIQMLVQSLLTREKLLGNREDRHEVIRLLQMAIDNQYAQEPDRFVLLCQWAILARSIRHPTTLTAYRSAMLLMQKSLSFAPTLSVQHARLVTMDEDCQTMPLDYASFQIQLGQFEEAVETLEKGRGLLWSEMRGLCIPMAQLIGGNSPLEKRFAEINEELEALTIFVTPSGRPDKEAGVALGSDGTDPFGRLVMKQRKLVEERDALISQVQGRPGLEAILTTPSFASLRSAASRGPVVIVNHCEWRSDILIIFHNSLPCAIPTSDGFYARANTLRDELVKARKHGLDSSEYQDALCSVLKDLYKLVGEPVIKRFRVLGVPEQSRIWWCPTSVFCSLPLHAMGPIPSRDTSKRYFSDLYIPSYTSSLSALIDSRKAGQQTLDKPSLLLVARPDDSLPGVKGEIKVIRGLKSWVAVTGLVSSEATPTAVVEGLRRNQFAHFACHGDLEAGKPFDTSFKLHGGTLSLLEIVRSRFPHAEFAFLSCCHTAEITEENITNEALHLTAAMQYCGFRSVVGTMWEMADTDGRDLAKSFYESLFSSRESGVPYYERSAHALRDATQKLRKKRGITPERWVNFVHYGA